VKFKKFILSLISALLMSIVIAKADVVSDEFNQRILSDDKFSSYPYLEQRNDIAVFYEF